RSSGQTGAPALSAGGTAVICGDLPQPDLAAGGAPALSRIYTLPFPGFPAATAAADAAPLYETFDVLLSIDTQNKGELNVSGSWDGPAAQRELLAAARWPQRGFDTETVWRAMLVDFALSARLPGAPMHLPTWPTLRLADTSPLNLPPGNATGHGLVRALADDPVTLPGSPAFNSFTTEFKADGSGYVTVQPKGGLACRLPLRSLGGLAARWAPLSQRTQDLYFDEWRIAREFIHIRAASRAPVAAQPIDLHFDFKNLIAYDLVVTPGSNGRWEATRTLRMRPGLVAAADYPAFKKVLQSIDAADQTVVAFQPANP
ncbi:MAG: hypothetical protein ACREJ2_09005, partial [Planctomycetota bacterium]